MNYCTIKYCNLSINCKGMCKPHYDRFRIFGDTKLTNRAKVNRHKKQVGCGVSGCVKKYYGLGYCVKHYYRLKRGKDIYADNKHGMSNSSEYNIYRHMMARCHYKKDPAYKDYGARGIYVCASWRKSFINFYQDMGKKPDGFTIERVNNNKGYSKENCIWADKRTQAINRRLRINSKSLYPGVTIWQDGRYIVKASSKDKKPVHIGLYEKLEEALSARLMAESVFDYY